MLFPISDNTEWWNGEDVAEDEEDDDGEKDEQGTEGITLTTQTAQIWLVALNVYIWKIKKTRRWR